MATTEKSCSETILENMKRRESLLTEIYKAADNGIDFEDQDPVDALYELPLGISRHEIIRIHLSTGGPADWLEVEVDCRTVASVKYHTSDWFDHAEVYVSEDSPLYRYAEETVELLDS